MVDLKSIHADASENLRLLTQQSPLPPDWLAIVQYGGWSGSRNPYLDVISNFKFHFSPQGRSSLFFHSSISTGGFFNSQRIRKIGISEPVEHFINHKLESPIQLKALLLCLEVD